MANLVNVERVSKTYGTRIILDRVTCGLGSGDVVGVVGRNGGGKSTLLALLTGGTEPDSVNPDGTQRGRVLRSGNVSIGTLDQAATHTAGTTVRDVIVEGRPDHVWASEARARAVVGHLLGDIDLDADMARLSGGERRRAELVQLLLGHHDLLVLDEPTNHLDVEAVAWLAEHLRELQQRGTAMLVVSHDRWFLDAVCTRVWEVHDAQVDAYDGGYAAYTLARAERARQAAAAEDRRQNLLRKELAWLRRGPPARTSKPRFRIDAANRLIEDVPEPRDRLGLQQFATQRLGKDVVDLIDVGYALPDGRVLLDDVSWSIGPGERIGLIGVNGAGKTTLLRLLAGDIQPSAGRVKQGRTLRLGHLTQAVRELDDSERVLESVQRLQRQVRLETGKEVSATTLLEDFGFTGNGLMTRVGELSGGERRRLQLLRLLLSEPNVLFLDEPTNDLDIDTLQVVEDYLDTWPGTLVVVSHDRYFLERVCDRTYALLGDGQVVMLPGGVEEYLERRRASAADATVATSTTPAPARTSDAAAQRQAKKDLQRIEGRLAKIATRVGQLHDLMAAHADDYARLTTLGEELSGLEAEQATLEEEWLEAAEAAG